MAYKEVWFGEGEGGYWGLEYVPDSPVATGKPVEPSAMSGTELIEYMQRNDFSPAQAAAATGISEGSIVSSVGKTIDPNSSLNLGGTIIQPVYSSRGEGDTFEQGSLSEVLIYNQNQMKPGDSYRTFATSGQQIGAGQFQKVGGFGQMLKEMSSQYGPIILAAATLGGGGAILGSTIGATIAPTLTVATQTIIGNALVQGTLSEAMGGNFVKGALTSVASAGINAYAGDVGSSMGITDSATATIVGKTLLQGALTEATGGDFIDGAVAGALSGAGQKIGETVGLKGSSASLVGTSITNGVIASVQGKDVNDAMINGAISGYLGYKEPEQIIKKVELEQLSGPTDKETSVPSVDQQTLNEVKKSIQDEETIQLAKPTDEEPIDSTEKEGSLAKETETTPASVDYKKLASLTNTLITGAGVYTATRPFTTKPSTTVTPPPTSSTVTTPTPLVDEDIYKDAPIKGFSMRPDASGRYIPYIGEKAQLAKGGFISKKTKKSGLASRR